MPHQCLKCGKVFPSGSPEILKGCGDCGGKKFFYTEEPVSEEEREHLVEQANKDIKVLIREILSQSQHDRIKTYDSEGREVPASGPGKKAPGSDSDWVKVSPPLATPTTTTEAGPEPVKKAAETPPHQTVKDILEQLKEKPELGLKTSKDGPEEAEAATTPEDEKKIGVEKSTAVPEQIDKAPAMTRPRKKGKVKLKRRTKDKKKRTTRPEVITMTEPGVYDISLAKLLKGFPVIINKDGTYLVHLPSVFEKMGKKKKET